MAWVRIDDQFASHPKLLKAGPLGLALHVAALCYCNRYLTDGFVPRAAASTLLDFTDLAMRVIDDAQVAEWSFVVDDLVSAGLWEPVQGGWQIHDYLDYQPAKAKVLEERQKSSERVRKWRNKDDGNAVTNSVGNNSGNGVGNAPPVPVPVPVPSVERVERDSSGPQADTDGTFDCLWSGWQTYEVAKGSKKQALEQWNRALRDGTTAARMIVQARAYCEHCRRTKTKTAAVFRWIRDQRWEDDYEPTDHFAEQTAADRRAILEVMGLDPGSGGGLAGGVVIDAAGVPGEGFTGDGGEAEGADTGDADGPDSGERGGNVGGDGEACGVCEDVRAVPAGREVGDGGVPGGAGRPAGGFAVAGGASDQGQSSVPRPAETGGDSGTGERGLRAPGAHFEPGQDGVDAHVCGPDCEHLAEETPGFLRRAM